MLAGRPLQRCHAGRIPNRSSSESELQSAKAPQSPRGLSMSFSEHEISASTYLVLLMPPLLFVMVPPWSEPGPEPP